MYIEKHKIALRLKPIFVGQLTIIEALREDAYAFIDGEFTKVLRAHESITHEFIKKYAIEVSKDIFVDQNDYDEIKSLIKDELLKVTRSLSVGDVVKNSMKHTHLLSLQMSNLYDNPFNDEILNSQYQSSMNLSSLMLKHKDLSKILYQSVQKQGHHYTIAQPLLSSILLLSFIQSIGLFSEKEIQNLFITSYFKDVGMSFIPREKFELMDLSDFDKKIFQEHAENSMKILKGRLPLNQTQLEMIKNHHFLNHKLKRLIHAESSYKEDLITGVESTLLCAIDTLVAMTNARPYREEKSIFEALELLKRLLSDDFSHEFKSLVIFIKHFFQK